MRKGLFLILAVSAVFFVGCQKKLITDNVGVNKWVHETTKDMYLWSSSLGGYVPTDIYPSQYFELLRHSGDNFSRVESNGGSSSGWSMLEMASDRKNDFGFAYMLNSGKAVISYVVPKSPAAAAGLKRGDVFDAVEVGGSRYELNSGADISACMSNATVKLCIVDPVQKKVEVSKSVFYDTPVICHKIIETSAGKTGYLVYNHFTSGENGRFLKELRSVISDFNAAGVKNMILDLRYNGGGELSAAVLLASMLSPGGKLGSPFVYLERNVHEGKNYRDFEVQRFLSADELGASHLDLDKLCIISLKYTASASELVLHGLKPFFGNDLLHIGMTTYGKNIGTTRVTNPRYLWSINLATMRVYDIRGKSGYEKGISPPAANKLGEEISTPGFAALGDFGETEGERPERMLSAAIYLLEHGSMPATTGAWLPSRSAPADEMKFPGAEYRGLTEGEIIKY